jgi:hypothetical protein
MRGRRFVVQLVFWALVAPMVGRLWVATWAPFTSLTVMLATMPVFALLGAALYTGFVDGSRHLAGIVRRHPTH